jgi:hypothetical protein
LSHAQQHRIAVAQPLADLARDALTAAATLSAEWIMSEEARMAMACCGSIMGAFLSYWRLRKDLLGAGRRRAIACRW